jgi:hypothetical protein
MAPEYALSYYKDLTYRISANAIRTAIGSDCIVVGATVPRGFLPAPADGGPIVNEFGMWMKPMELYMEVVKSPLADVDSEAALGAYSMPDPFVPGRFDAAGRDIDRFGHDYFIIGDVEGRGMDDVVGAPARLAGSRRHMARRGFGHPDVHARLAGDGALPSRRRAGPRAGGIVKNDF